MSQSMKGSAYRAQALGLTVTRATATTGLTGATGTLFTVSGGRIVLTSMVGELTIATGATASVAKLLSTPTTGSAVDLTSTTSVASKEVGAKLTLPATLGGALAVNNAGAAPLAVGTGFVIAIGSIQLNTSADPTGGGSAKWTLTYFPLDDAATVAAA